MHSRSKSSDHSIPFLGLVLSGVIFCAALIWLCIYVYGWEHRPHELEIHFFSVDGAPAIFIRTPQGHTVLIDGGSSDAVVHSVTTVMPFYDRHIDSVIVSNDDDMHVAGLAAVLGRYSVGRIIEADIPGGLSFMKSQLAPISTAASSTASTTPNAYSVFEEYIQNHHTNVMHVHEGDLFDIDSVQPPDGIHDGSELQGSDIVGHVYFPAFSSASDTPSFLYNATNRPTLSFSLSYGSSVFVFGGFISKREQKYISNEYAPATTSYSSGVGVSPFSTSSSILLYLPQAENSGAVDKGYFTGLEPQYVIFSKKSSAGKTTLKQNGSKGSNSSPAVKIGKSGKPLKPPKPPFSIFDNDASNDGGAIKPILKNITTDAIDGDIEFVSDGTRFREVTVGAKK